MLDARCASMYMPDSVLEHIELERPIARRHATKINL